MTISKKISKFIPLLIVLLLSCLLCSCGKSADGSGAFSSYKSRLLSLGTYQGLDYPDIPLKEPTDKEVEEEMQAILLWFEGAKLTDESIKEYLDFDSVEEFREDTRKNLNALRKQEHWNSIATKLFDTVIADSEFDLAQEDIDKVSQSYIDACQQMADAENISLAAYARTLMNMTLEELQDVSEKTAVQVIQASLTADAIIEREQLDIDELYPRIAGELAGENGFDSLEEFEENAGGKSAILGDVKYRAAAEYLMEHAVSR